MKIRVRRRTDQTVDTLDFESPIPTTLVELVERYGVHECANMIVVYLVKRHQDTARHLMRQGFTNDAIRRYMRTYQP